MISVTDAAGRKSCSGQAIRDAIKKGLLDSVVFGRTNAVKCNKKWIEWTPNPNMQIGGKARWGR